MSLKNLFKKKINVVTHSGTFHADDIFAVALLDLVNDGNISITRTRDQKIIDKGDVVVDVGMVYDVAKNRFDHHQSGGAGDRGDGIPYSACGLVWKHFGRKLLPNIAEWSMVDQDIIRHIDAGDNGYESFYSEKLDDHAWDFDKIFKTFNPHSKNPALLDAQFKKLVTFTKTFLQTYFVKVAEKIAFWDSVEKAYLDATDKRILVLPAGGSHRKPLLNKPEPLFVIFPDSGSTNWIVSAVSLDKATFAVRKKFPENWRGKKGDDFISVSGDAGASFCHNNGHMVVATSFESAMSLTQKALG